MVDNWLPADLFADPFPQNPAHGRPRANKKAPGACRRRPTRRILATFTGGELRVRARLSFTFVFLIVAASVVSGECRAQARAVRAQFTAEGVATCQQPALSNFPIVISGTGTLSQSGVGKLTVYGNVSGSARYEAKLGGRPTEAPGGSASLRVTGRSSLRATRDYPNNYTVIDLTVVGTACTIRVSNHLKPGKRQYTFVGGNGQVAYCSKPVFTRTSCSPI